MMLNEKYEFDPSIPTEVHIEHDGDEKYIIISTSPHDNRDLIKKFYLISLPLPYHADIAECANTIVSSEDDYIEVLGGGILTIDRENKFIKTYGTSGGYGSPPLNLLTHIINNQYSDWKKEITITDYIRG